MEKRYVKLNEIAIEWLKQKKIQVKPKSYDRIESTVRTHILPAFGKQYMKDISSKSIQKYINALATERSLSSVKKVREMFSCIYEYAIDLPDTDVTENPLKFVFIPHEANVKPVKEMQPLTMEEIQRLKEVSFLKHANGKYAYQYGVFYLFMLNTGIRRGEALALLWKDIDFENGLCHISKSVDYVRDYKNDGTGRNFKRMVVLPKTEFAVRTFALSEETLFYLSEFKKIQQSLGVYAENNPVLTSKNNKPLEERSFNKSYYAILKKAGIKQRGVQSLRDTFALLCYKNGYSFKMIHDLLGNSTISSTESYLQKLARLEDKKTALPALKY